MTKAIVVDGRVYEWNTTADCVEDIDTPLSFYELMGYWLPIFDEEDNGSFDEEFLQCFIGKESGVMWMYDCRGNDQEVK